MRTRIVDAVFGIFSTIKSRNGGGVTVNDSLTVTGTLSSTGAITATAAVTANQGVVLSATAVSGVTALMKDGSGDILLATGTTVPVDTTTGYAKGCLFIDTDVATGTTGLYCNKGTNTSCVFTAVTQA